MKNKKKTTKMDFSQVFAGQEEFSTPKDLDINKYSCSCGQLEFSANPGPVMHGTEICELNCSVSEAPQTTHKTSQYNWIWSVAGFVSVALIVIIFSCVIRAKSVDLEDLRAQAAEIDRANITTEVYALALEPYERRSKWIHRREYDLLTIHVTKGKWNLKFVCFSENDVAYIPEDIIYFNVEFLDVDKFVRINHFQDLRCQLDKYKLVENK